MMEKCKRMTVTARAHGMEFTNYNLTECTGVKGKYGCIHAEIALLKRIHNPQTVWISHAPCLKCAKALYRAGVKKMKFENEYRSRAGVEFLMNHGVIVYKDWVGML